MVPPIGGIDGRVTNHGAEALHLRPDLSRWDGSDWQ
jgi:hypothetical protein